VSEPNVPGAIAVLERSACGCLDAKGELAKEQGRRPRKVKVECIRCEALRELGVDEPPP